MKRDREVELGSIEFPEDVWNQVLLMMGGVKIIMSMRRISKFFNILIENITTGEIPLLETPWLYRAPTDILKKFHGVKSMVVLNSGTYRCFDKKVPSYFTRLESLEINGLYSPGPYQFLPFVCKNLKSLKFIRNQCSLPDLSHLICLESLELKQIGWNISSTPGIIPPTLTNLSISNSKLNIPFTAISHLTNLTQLYLKTDSFANPDIGEGFAKMTKLTCLKLNLFAFELEPLNLEPFASNLQTFHLRGHYSMLHDIDSLLYGMTNLTDFKLDSTVSQFDGYSLLRMPFLKKLSLEHTTLQNKYVTKLTTITVLELIGNYSVKDETLGKLTQLEVLVLFGDIELTPDCLYPLVNLRELAIIECKWFDEPDRKYLPDSIKIEYEPVSDSESTSDSYSDEEDTMQRMFTKFRKNGPG